MWTLKGTLARIYIITLIVIIVVSTTLILYLFTREFEDTQTSSNSEALYGFYDYFSLEEETEKHQVYLDYLESRYTTLKPKPTTTKRPRPKKKPTNHIFTDASINVLSDLSVKPIFYGVQW